MCLAINKVSDKYITITAGGQMTSQKVKFLDAGSAQNIKLFCLDRRKEENGCLITLFPHY